MTDRILSEIVEIDLDRCEHTYGVSPCTASGSTGSECYNTFKTCQDKANYSPADTHTIKFTKKGAPIPPGELVRPYVLDIDRAATEIDIEEGYAQRGSSYVRLADEPDSDIDEDPYQSTRASAAQGTFWTRLLARSPNVINRAGRISRAFVNGGVWGSARVEYFSIEEIRGPDNRGEVTLVLKDPVKQLDRIEIPAQTDGKLLADLPATSDTGTAQGATSTTITLADSASPMDDTYNGQEVYITGNIGAGQRRVISDYVGASRVATVSVAFDVTPNDASTYEVAPLELDVGSAYISQYRDPASTGEREFVRIGDEVVEYTAISGSKLTWSDGSYRAGGTDGIFTTAREDHTLDDAVQQCRSWIDKTFVTVLEDLFTAAGLSSGELDLSGWSDIQTEWFGNFHDITACLIEPAPGDELVRELLGLMRCVAWWDPVAQKVKLKAILPGTSSAASWGDEQHFIDRTVKKETINDLRRTRASVSFAPRDYTSAGDEQKHYKAGEIYTDADAESANEYGDERPENRFTRWFRSDNRIAMRGWAGRFTKFYRDAPVRMTVAVDPKDAPVSIGSEITVTSSHLTDETGAPKATRMIVTRVADKGKRLEVRLRATPFEKRYAFIAPNGTANHPTDTEYAHVCNSSNEMGDGSDPYLII